jgi:hypothetical protein
MAGTLLTFSRLDIVSALMNRARLLAV